MNRVVVTGLGVVSAIGISLSTFWESLSEGRPGIGPITGIPTERLNVKVAAEARDYNSVAHFDAKRLGLMDRVSQLAVVASRQAIGQAGIDFTKDEDGLGPIAERVATIIGVGVGGMETTDESYKRLYGTPQQRIHPFTVPRLMLNAPASHITMEHGLMGPAFVIASACASATHAVGQAFHMVRSGAVPIAVTGGAEACIHFGPIKSWEAMRVLASDVCRPFSKGRSGLTLGEGAAVLVLETLDGARRRGARILAEIIGFGMSSDARDITAPDVGGAARAISGAVRDSGLSLDAFDYINAHGTGTAVNDVTETRALRRVFGERAGRLMVSSSKSMFGHCLGAAGALEAVATCLALSEGVAPPTINYLERDPDCDLDYVPNVARQAPLRAALSNSFAFGGLNAVLAFRRFEGDLAAS
ncbi:Nodulation protein E [Azospirillaceae bacterium]